MDARTVIALGEVLPEHLPVAGERVLLAMHDGEPLERPMRESVDTAAQTVREIERGRRLEVDEHEARPGFERDAIEAVTRRLEVRARQAVRRSDQLAAQRIRPGMIRTHDALATELSALGGAELGAAMPAGIVKGVQASVAGACDHNGLIADAMKAIVAGIFQVGG